MGQLNRKFRSAQDSLIFFCPGCKETHIVRVKGEGAWTFNGDLEKPTFKPSVLVKGIEPLTEEEYQKVMSGQKIEPRKSTCHSFITNGIIEFLTDCTHELKGQKVEIPELPEYLKS